VIFILKLAALSVFCAAVGCN